MAIHTLLHASRWAQLQEAARPGHHFASHMHFLFSPQNKSTCTWMVGQRCQLQLWWMPHNKEPSLNHDDQCSCHLVQSPEACQARIINHCSVSLPHNACNDLPWAAALLKLPQTLNWGTHYGQHSPLCPFKVLGSAWLLCLPFHPWFWHSIFSACMQQILLVGGGFIPLSLC